MKIQCDCSKFQAELTGFPKNTPGRLFCYCNDCQSYLKKLGREDLLDAYGGTQIIPVYPSEISIISGKELLVCNRLSPNGLNRWSTSCCNSPIANTKAGFPWAGMVHNVFTKQDPKFLENWGPIKSRTFGKCATGNPTFEITPKVSIKDMLVVVPFIIRGKFKRAHKNSIFFKNDQKTPSIEPRLL